MNADQIRGAVDEGIAALRAIAGRHGTDDADRDNLMMALLSMLMTISLDGPHAEAMADTTNRCLDRNGARWRLVRLDS